MNRTPILALILAVLVSLPLTSRAADLHAGDRVRIHTTTADGAYAMTEGTVVSADGDNIVMQTRLSSGDTRNHEVSPYHTATIPLGDVTGVDRWVRTENHTFAGAAVGTALGMTVGYFVWKSDESKNASDALVQVHENAALPMFFCGVIGAAAGAVVGHAASSDVWLRDPSFKVDMTSTAPMTGAPALALNFDF